MSLSCSTCHLRSDNFQCLQPSLHSRPLRNNVESTDPGHNNHQQQTCSKTQIFSSRQDRNNTECGCRLHCNFYFIFTANKRVRKENVTETANSRNGSAMSMYNLGYLDGAAVRRRARDRKVAGSTPGRRTIKSTRSTQPSTPPG